MRNGAVIAAGAGGLVGLLGLLAASSDGQAALQGAAVRGQRVVYRILDDWMGVLIAKTSAHEGKFWSVQKNIDGNGVSYGIIQWTQLGGGLFKVLTRMRSADPDFFDATFGGAAAAARMMASVQAKSLAPVDGAVLWEQPWLGRFAAAGYHAPFQQAQLYEAQNSEYMRAAISIARMLGPQTERAMVCYYNRTVHQGPGGATGPAKRLVAAWANGARKPDNDRDILLQYTWLCAAQFRRTSQPESMAFNSRGAVWKQVSQEYPELTLGDQWQPGKKVVCPVPTWHVFSSSRYTVSNYDIITMRSRDILNDRTLRDNPVRLPGGA